MAKHLQIGDTVVFTGAVIRRCGHSPAVVDFRGTVQSLEGRIARTINSDGTSKSIPVANLAKVSPTSGILDLT